MNQQQQRTQSMMIFRDSAIQCIAHLRSLEAIDAIRDILDHAESAIMDLEDTVLEPAE